MTPKLHPNKTSELKETKKIKVVQLYEYTLKKGVEPYTTPKIAHQGPKKVKNDPKNNQNQRTKLKETEKMKVVELHEQTPKQFENPTQTPKIAHQGPKKWKKIK